MEQQANMKSVQSAPNDSMRQHKGSSSQNVRASLVKNEMKNARINSNHSQPYGYRSSGHSKRKANKQRSREFDSTDINIENGILSMHSSKEPSGLYTVPQKSTEYIVYQSSHSSEPTRNNQTKNYTTRQYGSRLLDCTVQSNSNNNNMRDTVSTICTNPSEVASEYEPSIAQTKDIQQIMGKNGGTGLSSEKSVIASSNEVANAAANFPAKIANFIPLQKKTSRGVNLQKKNSKVVAESKENYFTKVFQYCKIAKMKYPNMKFPIDAFAYFMSTLLSITCIGMIATCSLINLPLDSCCRMLDCKSSPGGSFWHIPHYGKSLLIASVATFFIQTKQIINSFDRVMTSYQSDVRMCYGEYVAESTEKPQTNHNDSSYIPLTAAEALANACDLWAKFHSTKDYKHASVSEFQAFLSQHLALRNNEIVLIQDKKQAQCKNENAETLSFIRIVKLICHIIYSCFLIAFSLLYMILHNCACTLPLYRVLKLNKSQSDRKQTLSSWIKMSESAFKEVKANVTTRFFSGLLKKKSY